MPRLTAEDLEQRRHGIGASDVPAILGISPWQNAADIFYAKTEGITQLESEAMSLGHALEPAIIAEGAARIASQGWLPAFSLFPGFPVERGIFRANIDAGLSADGLMMPLEAKLVGAHSVKDWDDGPPDYVAVQLQVQLEVTGAPRGFIAALLGGTHLEVYQAERDRELGADLVVACGDFWRNHVLAKVPPSVVGYRNDARLNALRHKTISQVIQATDAIEAAAAEYAEAKVQEKATKEYVEVAGTRLKEALLAAGGNVAVLYDGRRVRWSERPGRVSWRDAARVAGVTEAAAEKFRGAPFYVLDVT